MAVYVIYGLFVAATLAVVQVPVIVSLAIGIGCIAFFAAIRPSQLRRAYSNPDYRGVFRSRIFELEDGILRQMADDGTRSEIPLTSFVRVERRFGFFLLYLTPDYYFAVPERAVLSHGDREAFRAALLTAIPNQSGF